MSDKEKFLLLSWRILECKYVYYCSPPGLSCPTDDLYDKFEDLYRVLANKLELPASAVDMVGYDESRGSCRMVKEHLSKLKSWKAFEGLV